MLTLILGAALFASVSAGAEPTLKEAFAGRFLMGAALNEASFTGKNPLGAEIVLQQFNTISPENVLKWQPLEPRPGEFTFRAADRYVQFGESHHLAVIGHTLVWHSQTPDWVFADATRETLLARMSNHIHTVVGRYRGRIQGWDVVNEALNEDGTLRKTAWQKIIGDDYLEKAFQMAHAADPAAELYYNDYNLEIPAKCAGAVRLVKRLQSAGVRIDAVGIQEHVSLKWPSTQMLDRTVTDLAALGVKVNITELDVDVLPSATKNVTADVATRAAQNAALNPYTNGLPDSVQQALAARYADLFRVYRNHGADIGRVTFWGVTDGDSWLNNWPVQGRTSHPLLFDRAGRPKPAFFSVLQVPGKTGSIASGHGG